MKVARLSILLVLFAGLACLRPGASLAHPHIIDVARGIEVAPEVLLGDLRQVQVVFMGEFHDHAGHHSAQLAIIAALADDERPLAIGLEMFRRDSQWALDRWTANQLPLPDFLRAYHDNWDLWPAYQRIFLYARSRHVRMVGLNIPRSLTAKVAHSGFGSLSAEERMMLGNVQCVVSPTYGDFIRRALGVHGPEGPEFLHFCEAQLLWDTVMAHNLVDFLNANPDYRMVVMAGSGHAWKYGIPRQMLEQAEISYRVVLPEAQGRLDRSNVRAEMADYLWLDEGDDGWSFGR